MKFRADKTSIIAALAAVETHVERGNNIPILSHIKISVTGSTGTIVGTNLNQAASASFPCAVAEPGEICVPGDLFAKSIKGISSPDFTFTVEAGKAVVKAGKATFRVATLPADDFVPLPMMTAPGACAFTLAGDALARVTNEVSFAVSTDDNRPFLHGVQWEIKDGHLWFVATDGRKFSLLRQPVPDGAGNMPTILLAPLSLPKWQSDDAVKIMVTADFIRFECGGTVVASKLLDHQFPDWRRFTPGFASQPANKTVVAIDRDALVAAIHRASLYGDAQKGSSLQMMAVDGEFKIFAQGDTGDIEDSLSCEGHDMDGCTISHKVLLPVLNSFSCDVVELHFEGPTSPVTIHNPNDENRIGLTMTVTDARWKKEEKAE